MKTLILITDSNIIAKIFKLICIKNNLVLKVFSNFDNDLTSDILIIDDNFINDKFNFLKRHTKKLGAISTIDLGFNKAKDFLIKKPFLPTELETILKDVFEQVNVTLKKPYISSAMNAKFDIPISQNKQNNKSSSEVYTEPITSYLESLAETIGQEINDKNDDSIVSIKYAKNNGILDTKELAKIKQILEDSNKNIELENIIDDAITNETNEWLELSEIIDKTIDELSQKVDAHKPFKILLKNFEAEELKPLLLKLDKNALNELSNGSSLEIHLKLKD